MFHFSIGSRAYKRHLQEFLQIGAFLVGINSLDNIK
jgi:hypothetical protein